MALTKVSGSILKDPLNLGEVSIGGTLTYEDVTNVDSIGIITARAGIIDSTLTAGRVTYAGTNGRLVDSANLTFDGDHLIQTINGSGEGIQVSTTGDVYPQFTFKSNRGSNNNVLGYITTLWNNKEVGFISFNAGDDTTNKDNGSIRFGTSSANNVTERLRITSGGKVNIGSDTTTNTSFGLSLREPNARVEVVATNNSNSGIYLRTFNSGSQVSNATLRTDNSGNFQIYTGTTGDGERLRIDSNGNIGVNCTPSSSGGAGTLYGTVDHFIAIGDSDTGIAQDGDGQLELWANNQEIASFTTGQVTLKKVTQINNSIGVGILPQTSGSGSQFGARTYKICIGDNDTGIAQNGDGNLCFYSNNEELNRIDTTGISGRVKNNFIQKEFTRTDNSGQHGPLSTSFSTDGNISATISNYQRGQRIIIRATVPCGIALQNSSGTNYAGTSARIKLSNGSNQIYSNDRPVWYRADGSGIHETTQNLFICLYLNENNQTFNNGDTLTVTIEGKKNSGNGTSVHYIGGWSSVKEITVERYEKEL